jgi:uncharacterized membrane protein
VTYSPPPSAPALRPRWAAWFGDVVIVVFLIAQLLDGMLTYLGVMTFGVSEGNPLIAHYMHSMGVGPSLAMAKLVAVAGALVLHLLAFHRLLGVLTLLYLSLAVLPWTFVLFWGH